MSLAAAFHSARSSLLTTGAQTALVSRNIAGAGDPNYARKFVGLSTAVDGSVQITSTQRAVTTALLANLLESSASASKSSALRDGYGRLNQLLAAEESASYVPVLLGNLQSSFSALATSPASGPLAADVLNNANALARGLTLASAGLLTERTEADQRIGDSVLQINDLLKKFEQVDIDIVKNSGSKADITAQFDRRDAILSSLSEEIGVRVVERGNGSLSLFTNSGIVLYDGGVREVRFQPSTSLTAGMNGGIVYIDGVDATSANSPMPVTDGRLSGLVAIRDQVAPALQRQIDELARALIHGFSESDQSSTPSAPDAPGLFAWSGAPGLPGASAPDGLAGEFRVNPNADPALGGDLRRIRDGGLADPGNSAYVYNVSSAASFSERLRSLNQQMASDFQFNPAAHLNSTGSFADYAAALVAGVDGGSKAGNEQASQQSIMLDRTRQALTSQTGVNLDDEMSKMLDLEHAYQATAKLIATIDGMVQDLFQSVR